MTENSKAENSPGILELYLQKNWGWGEVIRVTYLLLLSFYLTEVREVEPMTSGMLSMCSATELYTLFPKLYFIFKLYFHKYKTTFEKNR